jgi:hypothetical protein
MSALRSRFRLGVSATLNEEVPLWIARPCPIMDKLKRVRLESAIAWAGYFLRWYNGASCLGLDATMNHVEPPCARRSAVAILAYDFRNFYNLIAVLRVPSVSQTQPIIHLQKG